MSNLEKLHLNLYASMKKTFIDGNNLKKNIINYMPRLNKFTFNIRSYLDDCNQFDLPTNEDIKHTFTDFKNNHIISCVDYFPSRNFGWCSIFTYPFPLKSYGYVTNNFPSVLCQSVREISLHDEHPFEYEFFLRTSHSFPFVEKLSLMNSKPPKNKLSQQSNKDNQDLSIIKFHHLTNLTLYDTHHDYIELFLDGTKTSLLNNIHLNVSFKPLKRATCRFTRNTTRINCEKVTSLCLNGRVLPKYARNYFPRTKIC